MTTDERYIIQNFDTLTSGRQNEILKDLIDIAVTLDAEKVLRAIVDKIGCDKATEKLSDITADYCY